jgi:hypothetical protein
MCNCIEKANKALEPHNTQLMTRESINMKTGRMSMVLLVPTCKINQRIRKPMQVLFANYCPLCGEKVKP